VGKSRGTCTNCTGCTASGDWVLAPRAQRRIGELSRELETGEPTGHGRDLPSGGKFKREALKAAGLSTSAAHRCEQLELGLGLAIRRGQAAGRIAKRGQTRREDLAGEQICTVEGLMGKPSADVAHALYPLTDGVTDEQFSAALGGGRP